ncbi:MAG TPA: hypothetical protein VN851_16265 [Thermoanaerobaculia bacterium]|nr:hypothetical protein [Thermoanaerobaculia bacterium]
MDDSRTTWALLVGVDVYADPNVKALRGPVRDVLDFRDFLLGLGVPDEQILICASPGEENRAALAQARPSAPDATKRSIDLGIVQLGNAHGTRLFVLLAGHGIYEPTAGRLFLPADFTFALPDTLGLDDYLDKLRSLEFTEQFVFLDGCQNLPYRASDRQRIKAGEFPNRGFTPSTHVALAFAFAAGQGQRAVETDGRGLFTRHLLAGLQSNSTDALAIDYDFASGQRTISLPRLIEKEVKPAVEREAAARGEAQTPDWQPFPGAGASSWQVCELPALPTVGVTLQWEPPRAAADVERLQVAFDEAPFWVLDLPKTRNEPIVPPIRARIPTGVRIAARCYLRRNSPWSVGQSEQRAVIESDREIRFDLAGAAPDVRDPRRSPGPTTRGDVPLGRSPTERGFDFDPRIVINSVGSEGEDFPLDYAAVAKELGGELDPDRGLSRGGDEVERDWGGSDLVLRNRLKLPRDTAAILRDAILRSTPNSVGVNTRIFAPPETIPSPRLRFRFPLGGAAAIAGFSLKAATLRVGPPGASGDRLRSFPLAEIENDPTIEIDAGPAQIEIRLPWGAWQRTLIVRASESTVVELPSQVGRPPLRVRLRSEAHRHETLVLGTAGEAPSGRIRAGLAGESRTALGTAVPGEAAWALKAASIEPAALAEISIPHLGTAMFPLLHHRPLGIDTAHGLRIEPLSELASPDWDLLLAEGRLDALSAAAARHLTQAKWEDVLLGLAGAYALWANPSESSKHLPEVIQNLQGLGDPQLRSLPDLDLLRMAMQPHGSLPAQDRDRLVAWAKLGAVPGLRWGVALAIRTLDDLLGAAPDSDDPLLGWRNQLSEIEPRLSPGSVWTAWWAG